MAEKESRIIYAAPSYAKEIELTVKEDIPEDTGKGVARIGQAARRDLGVDMDDEIEIIGPRVLKARVEKLEVLSNEEKAITIDKLIREKIPLTVGIKVAIRRPLES